MTSAMVGAALGAGAGTGLALVAWSLTVRRRPRLADRVLPYVQDLPQMARGRYAGAQAPPSAVAAVFGPVLRSAAEVLERTLGGSASIRRRLERANSEMTLQEFRISQVLWGVVAFGVAAAVSLGVLVRDPGRVLPVLLCCGVAFVLGVLLRENRLSAVVARRERRILAEFPTVAELLALAVAAGEGPVVALDRVVRSSRGELAADLAVTLGEIRTGKSVSRAMDDLAARSGLPAVARFAEGVAVAVERGTPLADVLHAQAADVRVASRRALIESGARREIAMMVPVVFLVLPVTVLFAFWPGLVGLRLATP